MVTSVSSLAIVRLLQETIVVQRLPLNVARIILGWIFTMIFVRTEKHSYTSYGDMDEVFHADAKKNVHLFVISWYFNSISLWQYLYSCTHIMSIIFSAVDSVSSVSLFIVYEVLKLNIAMLTMPLCLCNFGFVFALGLGSVSNISKT